MSAQATPPPVVPSYNLSSYLGIFYQIADFREPYELLCNACTHATYGLNENGTVSVHNQCNEVSPKGPARCGFPLSLSLSLTHTSLSLSTLTQITHNSISGIFGYAFIPDPSESSKLSVVFFDKVPKKTNYW